MVGVAGYVWFSRSCYVCLRGAYYVSWLGLFHMIYVCGYEFLLFALNSRIVCEYIVCMVEYVVYWRTH